MRGERNQQQLVSGSELPASAQLVIGTLDARAFGVAVGSVLAAGLVVCTLILVNRGGEAVGPNLALFSQYFIGYSVTMGGSVVGGVYMFVLGFGLAYSFAKLRDFLIRFSLRLAWNRAQRRASRDLLDHLT